MAGECQLAAPPRAWPLMAAMVGFSNRSTLVHRARPTSPTSGWLMASATSMPAEKHRSPAPVMTSTRDSLSEATSARALSSSPSMA